MIRVYAYKGVLGFNAIDEKTDKLSKHVINAAASGQMGIIANASGVIATKEAIEILRSIKPGREVIGDVNMFKTKEGKEIFGWPGGALGFLDARIPPEGSIIYDTKVTDSFTVADIDIPADFKRLVDKMVCLIH